MKILPTHDIVNFFPDFFLSLHFSGSEGEDDTSSVANSLEKEGEKDVPCKRARSSSLSSDSQSEEDEPMDTKEEEKASSPPRGSVAVSPPNTTVLADTEVKNPDKNLIGKEEEVNSPLNATAHSQDKDDSKSRTLDVKLITQVPVIESFQSSYKSTDLGIDLSQKRCESAQSIRSETDQPLDLSLKPSRGVKPKIIKKENVFQSSRPLSPELSSSLASLEKKFGDGAFRFEGLGSKLSTSVKPKMLERFNTSAFRNALFGLPVPSTKNFAEKSLKSNIPLSSSSSSPKVPAQSNLKHQLINNNNKEKETINSEPIKHTDFECSCKKVFKTLYELSVHMQETGHTPNNNKSTSYMEYPKLVRGQDMWLNQGMEQTRQILCCMMCSESFKSLPELTVHMMQTRHYANIVSTEGRAGKTHKCSSYCDKCVEDQSVFKCKVCADIFTDMEGLANHMITSGHHKKQASKANDEKEHGKSSKEFKKSAVNGNSLKPVLNSGTVAALLENKQTSSTYRFPDDDDNSNSESTSLVDSEPESSSDANRIRCENCNEKIETCKFVEHVRKCIKTKPCVLDTFKAGLRSPEKDFNSTNSFHRIKKEKSLSNDNNNKKNNDRLTPSEMRTSHTRKTQSPSSPHSYNNSIPESSPKQALVDYPFDVGGSALKAMESFIERSFTPSKPKKSRNRSHSSHVYPPVYNMDYCAGLNNRPLASLEKLQSSFIKAASNNKVEQVAPDSTASETGAAPSGVVKHEGQSEIRHQSVIKKTHIKHFRPVKSIRPPVSSDENEDEAYNGDDDDSKPESCKKEIVCKVEKKNSSSPVSTKSDGTVDEASQLEPKEEKYVCDTSSDISSSKSALESLQGLVYSHSFATEHPLDSLQRLIHTTNAHTSYTKSDAVVTVMPSTSTSSGSLAASMPGTVILVNPIVTVLPQSSPGSTTQVQITIPDNVASSPDPSKSGPKSSGGESDSEGGGEFCCQACSRTFVSKGSYRYHLSRCHLSSVKKYGFKEAFNMSPYVYLPLDHTAKFSKYYKMANELANKSKNSE